MNILDILSPLKRHKIYVLSLFLASFFTLFGLSSLLGETFKTTLFYTVIPTKETPFNNHTYATEGAERVTETIAGWTKNPGFREEILETANLSIDNFKRKISARKQNKLNLIVNLNTDEEESVGIDSLAAATNIVFKQSLDTFNKENSVTFTLQGPDIYTQSRAFPLSWIIAGCLLLAFCFSILTIYLKELLGDKVSFFFQINQFLKEHKVLRIASDQDELLLPSFEGSLTSPSILCKM